MEGLANEGHSPVKGNFRCVVAFSASYLLSEIRKGKDKENHVP